MTKLKTIRKIDKYIISDKVISKLNTLIKETAKDGIERGYTFCGNSKNKDISIGTKCVGTICLTPIAESKCKKGEFRIGDFHTHPWLSSDASPNDLLISLKENKKLACVGSTGGINCYTPKIEKNCNKNIKSLSKVINDTEESINAHIQLRKCFKMTKLTKVPTEKALCIFNLRYTNK